MFIARKRILIQDYKETAVYAPLNGKVMDIEAVDDQVFSKKLMGDGIAIDPVDGLVYSPVSGKVVALFPTHHAIGIESVSGAQIIVHIGIDTVHAGGSGFKSYVHQDDFVEAGQLLVKVNYKQVKAHYSLMTMIVVENSDEFEITKTSQTQVTHGSQILNLKRREQHDNHEGT